ncbi:Tectonic-1 [Manis javanica]|nr:Tectonic-1 [Manis javanica]
MKIYHRNGTQVSPTNRKARRPRCGGRLAGGTSAGEGRAPGPAPKTGPQPPGDVAVLCFCKTSAVKPVHKCSLGSRED